MKWYTGLNDFTTPDVCFHSFHFAAAGTRSHAITAHLSISMSKQLSGQLDKLNSPCFF